jgi:acetolactate synthase I/II/III large subunit
VGHSIDVLVIVLNNAVLGCQKDAEQVKFGRYTSSGRLGRIDHAAIARACGAHGTTVTSAAKLHDAIRAAISSAGPALRDVYTDPGAHPPISLYDNTLDITRVSNAT